jgi:hypothetical protein
MTAKNFDTFNILIEFESICAFAQVLVATRKFRFALPDLGSRERITATMRCRGKSGEVVPPKDAIDA